MKLVHGNYRINNYSFSIKSQLVLIHFDATSYCYNWNYDRLIIQGIIHINSVGKKKVMTDRIRAHLLRTDDDNNDEWSIEKLESMLTDHDDQSIIELIGDKYKTEQTQGHTLTDNTQVESITMMVPETQNTTHITSFTILYFQRLKKPGTYIGSATYS